MSGFTVTSSKVPDPGADNHVPINQGAADGGRITSPGFLSGIQPGQDQALIHAGDQSIKIDKTQWVRITEKRDTEVGQDELYVNKAQYDHQVQGPYIHKHHKTTKEEYVLDTNVDYYAHIRVKEHVGDTRIRNIQDTVIINGSEYTTHNGTRTRLMWGVDTNITAPLRITAIGGLDLKAAILDSSFTAIKDSNSLVEAKATIIKCEIGCAKSDIRLFNFLPFGLLIRVGGLCLKGVGGALGSIRW
ncbi:MAG TPA: hypothetical protein VJ302_20205 [Blastocatellia bacterium]|nr:hypothetical protein [Blastocatellia bacterium]